MWSCGGGTDGNSKLGSYGSATVATIQDIDQNESEEREFENFLRRLQALENATGGLLEELVQLKRRSEMLKDRAAKVVPNVRGNLQQRHNTSLVLLLLCHRNTACTTKTANSSTRQLVDTQGVMSPLFPTSPLFFVHFSLLTFLTISSSSIIICMVLVLI